MRLGYIEVPLNLLYKPILGNGHLLLGFGPYIAYGITVGKDNDDVIRNANINETNILRYNTELKVV